VLGSSIGSELVRSLPPSVRDPNAGRTARDGGGGTRDRRLPARLETQQYVATTTPVPWFIGLGP
jgi:hypothetical protein